MKHYIFRKDYDGFKDWCESISSMRFKARHYRHDDPAYTEANLWYVNYLSYMKGLNDLEKEYIHSLEKHHIPSKECIRNVDIDKLLDRWMEIVAPFKLNQLQEITNKEVGAAIKRAREVNEYNRKQIALILGISQDTLKCYEEGRRALPFDIYYKLIQIFEINIGIIKMK